MLLIQDNILKDNKILIHLRARVQFPTGGIRNLFLQPANLNRLIWLNSKADSIVWMGEGEGAVVSRMLIRIRLFKCTLFSLELYRVQGIIYVCERAEPFFLWSESQKERG